LGHGRELPTSQRTVWAEKRSALCLNYSQGDRLLIESIAPLPPAAAAAVDHRAPPHPAQPSEPLGHVSLVNTRNDSTVTTVTKACSDGHESFIGPRFIQPMLECTFASLLAAPPPKPFESEVALGRRPQKSAALLQLAQKKRSVGLAAAKAASAARPSSSCRAREGAL